MLIVEAEAERLEIDQYQTLYHDHDHDPNHHVQDCHIPKDAETLGHHTPNMQNPYSSHTLSSSMSNPNPNEGL